MAQSLVWNDRQDVHSEIRAVQDRAPAGGHIVEEH